jgi:hypothetical protein
MENVNVEMIRRRVSAAAAGSRIPQCRATPLKGVSDIRVKLERERTFTKEETEVSPAAVVHRNGVRQT